MIAVSPDYFWGLTNSLLDSGYLPTENIIVLESDTKPALLITKEGNRRVAALKIILGIKPLANFPVPTDIINRISSLTSTWKSENSFIPCAIYPNSDSAVVDRIVTLTHGKNEKAGRDQWEAIARARHNRDSNKVPEPALDLLEKYLQHGLNINQTQRDRWAGNYPVTVLADAMKKLAPRLGATSTVNMAGLYPTPIAYRNELEQILYGIGLNQIGFHHIRSSTVDFASAAGIPAVPKGNTANNNPATSSANNTTSSSNHTSANTGSTSSGTANTGSTSSGATGSNSGTANTSNNSSTSASSGSSSNNNSTSSTGSASTSPIAFSTRDPKAVTKLLKQFTPRGANREKVVELKDEALKLKLKETPLAFCFLLRSMFEISAKAYCKDNSAEPRLQLIKNGKEKSLAALLGDVIYHLTHDSTGAEILVMTKKLHGAKMELNKPAGILSVTSLNQLIHNPAFSVITGDVCVTFGNIYSLLEEMN